MDNVRFLKNLYEAFGRGDIPTVLGAMSSDIRWYQAEGNPYMPSGEAWVGPDAVLNNLFMKLGAEWGGFAVHPKSFHGAGDSVIVEARYSGTYKATGKSIDVMRWKCPSSRGDDFMVARHCPTPRCGRQSARALVAAR